MLKIAVVTRYFPSSGEPWQGRSAYQSLRALKGRADVRVFYPNAAYPQFLRPRSRLYRGLDRSFSPSGVDVTYLNYPALPLVSRPFNGSMAARTLLPDIRAFQPDLIFAIFLYPEGYAAVEIGRKLHVPVVAMGIGSDVHSIADRFSKVRTRKVLKEADFVITVSDDLRRKAIALGASSTESRAVLNGCDLSIFHPSDTKAARLKLGLDLNAPTVVYIGRMDMKKGLLELVNASVKLHVSRPNLQVCMVGEGPDRARIVAAVEGAGAGSYIQVLPPCAPDEVAVWMAAADVVTLPSYMEGCPNVVLEALACGRPVVATEVGGIPEIMNATCGRLIPPRDSAALADALGSVLADCWDADAIASQWSRSWGTVAGELLDIFTSVVTRKPAGSNGQ